MTVTEEHVLSMIQDGKYLDAVKSIIANCNNAGRKHPQREHALKLMMKVFVSVKSSEIENVVNALELDEVDVLMRYIYHGFEQPTDNSSAHLLTWHDKASNRGGVGSIVRVLTEH